MSASRETDGKGGDGGWWKDVVDGGGADGDGGWLGADSVAMVEGVVGVNVGMSKDGGGGGSGDAPRVMISVSRDCETCGLTTVR